MTSEECTYHRRTFENACLSLLTVRLPERRALARRSHSDHPRIRRARLVVFTGTLPYVRPYSSLSTNASEERTYHPPSRPRSTSSWSQLRTTSHSRTSMHLYRRRIRSQSSRGSRVRKVGLGCWTGGVGGRHRARLRRWRF